MFDKSQNSTVLIFANIAIGQIKMNLLHILVSLLLVVNCQSHSHDELLQQYTYHVQLDRDGRYYMFYSIDEGESLLLIAVRVQTTGWIGLGLSPNGQMPGSDVAIGWVDNAGKSFLQVKL